MTTERRSFRRQSEGARREQLIIAALDLMAEGGPKAATVRAIAERAGITPGLIRHYFQSKDELTRAAYRYSMDRMTTQSATAPDAIVQDDPAKAIAGLVCASLRPPVMEGERVRLWAGFLHMVHREPAMREIHESTYLGFRDEVQRRVARLPHVTGPDHARRLAIAVNAVIDGLWLEGGLLPGSFAEGEVEQIGLDAVSAILGVELTRPEEAE